MERFRCAAKLIAQGHYKRSLGGSTAALSSVASVSINRFVCFESFIYNPLHAARTEGHGSGCAAAPFGAATGFYTCIPFSYPEPACAVIVGCPNFSFPPYSINRYYNHCAKAMVSYTEGFNYGTKASIKLVYKGCRQVVD